MGESELIVSANIDPYFRGQLVAALTPENEVEVEEAFFQTLMLGRGFTLKGGRFLSGIGYQNEIHQHAWDFQDAPLAYKAFLGGRFNDDGLQLRWLAPTDLFLEFGAEAGNGDAFPGTRQDSNDFNTVALFGSYGLNTALSLVVSVAVVRHLGRSEYGVMASAEWSALPLPESGQIDWVCVSGSLRRLLWS